MQSVLKPEKLRARIKPFGEQIAESLQREIIGGKIKPGQRIIERQLVERFGVSSIPVREALQMLESRGLLVRRHNAGCSVIKLAPKEALRICEIRLLVEPQVAAWAAERITKAASQRLNRQLDRLEQVAARGAVDVFFQEDIAFHRLIWEAADNPYATRSLEMIMGSLFASGLISGAQRETLNLTAEVAKHRRLAEAISGGEPEAASRTLIEIASAFERHVSGGAV